MRILLLGMRFFGIPDNGSEVHIDHLARGLRAQGHYVEIFTSTIKKVEKLPEFGFFIQDGIKINYVNDGRFPIYNDFKNPISEIKDKSRENYFKRFLKDNPNWDIIHYHHFMPLSVIEISKNMGYNIIVTLHDYHIVSPIWDLVAESYQYKYPFKMASLESVSIDTFVQEYVYRAKVQNINISGNKIEKQMRERVLYGIYLLNNIVDKIVCNGFAYGYYYTLFFNINMKKMQATGLEILNDDKGMSAENIGNDNIKLLRSDMIIFGNLDYFYNTKGQHIILKAISRLRKYENRFRVKFFGRMLNYKIGNTSIKEIVENDDFILKHTSYIEQGYTQEQLPMISKQIDINISARTSIWGGCGTVIYQAKNLGVPSIFNGGDFRKRVCDMFFHKFSNNLTIGVNQLIKSEFNNKKIDVADLKKYWEYEGESDIRVQTPNKDIYYNDPLKDFTFDPFDYYPEKFQNEIQDEIVDLLIEEMAKMIENPDIILNLKRNCLSNNENTKDKLVLSIDEYIPKIYGN